MSTLKSRLARSLMERELSSLYKITEGDVESTAVRGYPISGQPTGQPSGVATATTAPTPQPGSAGSAPQQPDSPEGALPAAGEEVCSTTGDEHVAVETELFQTVSEIVTEFEGFMSGCEGEQYAAIRATVEQLKSQLAAHLASYDAQKQPAPTSEAPVEPAADPAQPTTTVAPAQSVGEGVKGKIDGMLLESQEGQYFNSQIWTDECVYWIGDGASESFEGEPSGDYIYFADLRGAGEYIEFVINNRVVNTIDMPDEKMIRRDFGKAFREWVNHFTSAFMTDDLQHEMDMIVIAYMQAVKQVSDRGPGQHYEEGPFGDECPTCNGDGNFDDTDEECPDCRGTGTTH